MACFFLVVLFFSVRYFLLLTQTSMPLKFLFYFRELLGCFWTYYVTLVGLEFVISLPQFLEYWDYKHVRRLAWLAAFLSTILPNLGPQCNLPFYLNGFRDMLVSYLPVEAPVRARKDHNCSSRHQPLRLPFLILLSIPNWSWWVVRASGG